MGGFAFFRDRSRMANRTQGNLPGERSRYPSFARFRDFSLAPKVYLHNRAFADWVFFGQASVKIYAHISTQTCVNALRAPPARRGGRAYHGPPRQTVRIVGSPFFSFFPIFPSLSFLFLFFPFFPFSPLLPGVGVSGGGRGDSWWGPGRGRSWG